MPGTIHVFDLLKKKKAPKERPTGLVPLFGGQRFLQKLAERRLVEWLVDGDSEFATSSLDGDSADWKDVADQLFTNSLFGGSGPKLVVVDNGDAFVKKFRDRLESLAKDPPQSAVMMLKVSSWAKNTKLYKAIDKGGFQVNCDPPKKGKGINRKSVADWISARAKSDFDFELSAHGALTVVDLTDCDFGRMDQELAKLSLYTEDGKLDESKLVSIVGGWRTQKMWDAVDAATDGESGKALELLDQLLKSGEHPLALFGQLSWSLRRFGKAAELAIQQQRDGRRIDLQAAVAEAGFNSWGGEQTKAVERLTQLSAPRAAKILDWLLEADLQLKRSHSKADRGRLVLEKLFVRMDKELSPRKKAKAK